MEHARGRFCPCSKFVSKMLVAVVLAEGKHHCPWEAASVHSIPCECKAMMPYTCAATSRGCTQALLRFVRANQGVQSPVLMGCSSGCMLLPRGLSTNHPCGCAGLREAGSSSRAGQGQSMEQLWILSRNNKPLLCKHSPNSSKPGSANCCLPPPKHRAGRSRALFRCLQGH